ncbi:rolling circle replication-associated protein [Cohnella yongneupensis]|uniref:Replication-associated protein ORF2/G2P domain-containing protein n=1 Tax=Cohnella yongneupensis TaxID=425006 RepID=A0ABW0QTM9_9BACL
MEVEKVFRNTRIYDLNGDYEAILCRTGWKINNPKKEFPQTKRGESKDYEQNRAKTLQKARSKIRRLIKFYKLDRFVTLTFAENEDDLKAADREFRKFMKRLLRKYPDFKYVGVREFQQRGAIHYHLAVNTFIPHAEISEIWGKGFVWVERKTGRID